MEIIEVCLSSESITLGQLLKYAGIVETGGQAKDLIQSERIWVNGIETDKRGQKIFAGDDVTIGDSIVLKVK